MSLLAVSIVTQAFPAPASAVELVRLTLDGPTTTTVGATEIYSGRLTTAGLGVPLANIRLLLDGDLAASARTEVDGSYSVAVVFADAGEGTLQAVAVDGTPLEARSDPLTVSVESADNPFELDEGVSTDLFEAGEFLYSGPDAVQTGMAPGTLERERAAILRGRVLDRTGAPLTGVRVTVADHPEFGATTTQTDGIFDIAVNGGGTLTVQYEKVGFLPVDRRIEVPWEDYTWLPDVVLTALDDDVTTVDLGSSESFQVVRGSVSEDGDGPRRATLLFEQGTEAEMVLADDSRQPLTELDVRATEYTVGTQGADAMPATLPDNSAYTYAVDFTVDQALAANATEVRFSQPVISYTENFLAFPAGVDVPIGYYDRAEHEWVPSDNGRVIDVIGETGGRAELDVDGDGQADGGEKLSVLGITETELEEVAALYDPGQSLWRVEIDHFTPFDYNWPYGLPFDAIMWFLQGWIGYFAEDGNCNHQGSVIECPSQVLGEDLSVAGTPFSLVYRSDRTPGRKTAVDIPLSGDDIPPSLKRIELIVTVGGQQYTRTFEPAPNLKHRFTWDRKDPYGRTTQGSQPLGVAVGYVYDAVYSSPAGTRRDFARFGSDRISQVRTRNEITVWERARGLMGDDMRNWDARGTGLGGWSLDVHHSYDTTGRVLYLGSGERRSATAQTLDETISTLPLDATLNGPTGLAMGPDGTLYVADSGSHRILRVGRDGNTSVVVGTGEAGFAGDGGPASEAMLRSPSSVAMAPDGSLLIVDKGNHRVREVTLDGRIQTIMGDGEPGYSGDGGLATEAGLDQPSGLAVAPDGAVYVSDTNNHRIRAIDTAGIVETVAGNGQPAYSGDDGPANAAGIRSPGALTVGSDGSLYFADIGNNAVRRIRPDGTVVTLPGYPILPPQPTFTETEPEPIKASALTGIAARPDGGVYTTEALENRVLLVTPDGTMVRAAGGNGKGSSGDGGPAAAAELASPSGVAVGPDGAVYVSDTGNNSIRLVAPAMPGVSVSELLIPSGDGTEVFVFSERGRHLRTLDALTGAIRYSFGYDGSRRLVSIEDGDGNLTLIERDATAAPTALLSPYGQRTALELDQHGSLDRVTDPEGDSTALSHTADGLLTGLTDSRGNEHNFEYDDLGLLVRDDDPAGGFSTLDRRQVDGGYAVDLRTAEGAQTTYKVIREHDRTERSLITDPSGGLTETERQSDGTSATYSADGTLREERVGPDPRWGMQVPLLEEATTYTPNGRSLNAQSERTVSLSDPRNPLSLTRLTDTVTIEESTTTKTYDASTHTITEISPEGRERLTTLDTEGRPVLVRVGGLAPVQISYDGRGRIEALVEGEGVNERRVSLTYDDAGLLATQTDPEEQVVSFSHDLIGRVTNATLEDSSEIEFSYDPGGNLAALTPPGRDSHSFGYTPVDLRERSTAPAVESIDRDTSVTYNRDRKPTRVRHPGGEEILLSHDEAGRVTALQTANATINHSYDPWSGMWSGAGTQAGDRFSLAFDGPLVSEVLTEGVAPGSATYEFDEQLQVASRSINGEAAIPYGYDLDGLVTQAGDLGLTRDHATGLLRSTGVGQVTGSSTYDEFGELTSHDTTGTDSEFYSASFERDLLGRITQHTETTAGETTEFNYVYDARGRLTDAARDGTAWRHYDYDANGNRTGATEEGSSVTASYDAQDRLTSYGTDTYAYSPRGQLSSKTSGSLTTTYDYDELGNLMKVVLPTKTVDYVVDGMGRRIVRKVDGTVTGRYLYGQGILPIAELNVNGSTRSQFVYATRANVPDLMIRGGTTYRIAADHLGSVRVVVDTATGEVVQRLDYDPFGKVIGDTNPGFQPFGFGGGLADPDTGLVRFGARDYDPETGRFTAKDPIGFEGGDTNLYAYVGGDPINRIDPLGLDWVEDLNDSVGGFVDGLTTIPFTDVSLMGELRDHMVSGGIAVDVDRCSWGYGYAHRIGGLEQAGLGVLAAAPAYLAGREYSIGQNLRIAPWGSRGPGRFHLPHYHRRVFGPDGKVVSGGSKKWHRPWQRGW